MSDNAPEFTSEVMNKLCKMYDINKVEITAYKPSSNGAVERANQKVKNILKSVITPATIDWDVYVEDVQLVINNSINVSTGESPHFLLYGYNKRLPISLCDDARPPRACYNYDDYISLRMQHYFKIVRNTRKEIQKAQDKWAIHYKSKEKIPVKVGSQVYVQKFVPEGPNIKLSPRFDGPYRVVELLKGNKFRVVHETEVKEIIVHYNHIKIVKANHDPLWLQAYKNEEDHSDSHSGGYNLRRRN